MVYMYVLTSGIRAMSFYDGGVISSIRTMSKLSAP
jgi:hypothetical protein